MLPTLGNVILLVLSDIFLFTLLHKASAFLSMFWESADYISPLVLLKMEFSGLLYHSRCFFCVISINKSGIIISHGVKFILKVYTHFTDKKKSGPEILNNLIKVT